MNWRTLACLGTVLTVLGVGPAMAQQFGPGYRPAQDRPRAAIPAAVPEKNAAPELKREWIREQMLREFRGTGREQQVEAAVARMSPGRIDQILETHRKRRTIYEQEMLAAAGEELARSQAYRDYLVQQYHARLAAARGGRPVGYAPVIAVLPEGASLGASAVVSPDRRYVRISATPFFSGISALRTFNYRTGETRTVWPRPPHRPPPHHPRQARGAHR
jgi:hypothetical protein